MRTRQTYDVAVVGGGTAGAIAAIAAARTGARTLLVEQYGSLGGVLTLGMSLKGVHDGEGRKALGGIGAELIERARAIGGAAPVVALERTSARSRPKAAPQPRLRPVVAIRQIFHRTLKPKPAAATGRDGRACSSRFGRYYLTTVGSTGYGGTLRT